MSATVNVNRRITGDRDAVISVFDHGFLYGEGIRVDVREQILRDADLFGADEALLTSTTREAVPIVTVNDRTIGTGKPGLVTWKLLKAFRALAEAS